MRRVALLISLMSAAALLAACAAAPESKLPESRLPAAYPGAATATNGTRLASDWWTLFNDPVLNGLVDAALVHNADLRLAVARVDAAAAALGVVRSAGWPSVDLGAAATRLRVSTLNGQPTPTGGAESSTHRLALSSSFEIDLWGRLRNANAQAQAELLAAQHCRATVRLVLAGTTAQLYFGLRAMDAQLAVIDTQLRARQEGLQIVERRLAGGVASTLEQAQARAALAATSAALPELRRQRALLAHQLGEVTGQAGLSIGMVATALPTPVAVPAGLPSALLVQRPDVQQAEASLRAAQAQVAVARAAMFPTLSLTGSLGGQSADLADLFKSGARIWSIGPSLLLPLFDGGRNVARTEQARAQAEQVAIGYQKVVQTAFREVADALVGVEEGARQEREVEMQQLAAGDALRIAQRRYEVGYSGYLEVLDAERAAQDTALAGVRARQLRLDASVALMKSLGGGWSAPR